MLVRELKFHNEFLLWILGESDIPGLTDTTIPRRLGPKRASKIRKLFNLSKEDDVRQYVVRRPLPAKEGNANIVKNRDMIQYSEYDKFKADFKSERR